MGRWQPGTRERLQGVALELFARQGYEATTVADIAEQAHVTERTFYRYFADKREVLFDGQDRLTALFVDAVRSAPAGASPLQLATAALDRLGEQTFAADEAAVGAVEGRDVAAAEASGEEHRGDGQTCEEQHLRLPRQGRQR